MDTHYDCIVIGGGSAGIGAALASTWLGSKTLLLERANTLGGTAVRSGVSVWEMGAGGTGACYSIYRRMRSVPGAVGVYSIGRHILWDTSQLPYPGGENVIDPTLDYADTLRRFGAKSMKEDEAFARTTWHGIPFEPQAYLHAVHTMLEEYGDCTVRAFSPVVNVKMSGEHIDAVFTADTTRYTADTYIDCTSGAAVARAAGVQITLGQESHDTYYEPDAPVHPSGELNGASLIYRVWPQSFPKVTPLPDGIPADCWWNQQFPVSSNTHYPDGSLHINMLPTMSGRQARDLGRKSAYQESRRRVLAHWHHLQANYEEFRHYALGWIAPELGVREDFRIIGQYVMTEHDLLAGLSGQQHQDIIAIADHAMDTHGTSTGRAGCRELSEPYGIPYRCLLPRNVDNLLVASHSASFSSLAASSCRLTRTMMQLGQAAGTAAALAKDLDVLPADIPLVTLRGTLERQHVQLQYPMTPELKAFVGKV